MLPSVIAPRADQIIEQQPAGKQTFKKHLEQLWADDKLSQAAQEVEAEQTLTH